ncbi:FUSC family protein [Pontibacter virosus]|uniref:Fusaric acid resistance family protein n=1 Tax=Pontibacter virosus TaxID=1765052 RepID=A0A2U1ALQ6_9BACT|nr:FUSC family protein [Pontibacter virosus]PVY37346.1 fusaric acid resistance family protein [Pontibacter virosus]
MANSRYSIDVDVVLYIIRCIIGFLIGYTLYLAFPQVEFFWTMLSILLVLSPEIRDSSMLTVERIKSNLIGSSVGLLCVWLPVPQVLMMVIGIAVSILVCHFFNLMDVARTAVVALVIVVTYEKEVITNLAGVERFLCVTLGCVIGYGVSAATSFLSDKLRRDQTS